MKLNQVISPKWIVTDLSAKNANKTETIKSLLNCLKESTDLDSETLSYDEILKHILEREKQQSTALGDGFAFPHARFDQLKGSYIIIGICPEGIDFDSMDGQVSQIFIMTLLPSSEANKLLQTRAAFTRFFTEGNNKEKCLTATRQEIYKLFEASAIKVNEDILAKDIMRPAASKVPVNATLQEAALLLHFHKLDSLPVLDDQGHFIRELSCHDLFCVGLPEFFFSLHKISFVKHMNPFERYFQVDKEFRINQLKEGREAPTIAEDATLMEIIFSMTTANQEILYVLNKENKLLGIIDRFSIIDKILTVV